jgi:hypothetical protein
MKKYTVKNYKGNLVESLSKFQKSHKNMKVIEAIEEGNSLKITCNENDLVKEDYESKLLDSTKYFKICSWVNDYGHTVHDAYGKEYFEDEHWDFDKSSIRFSINELRSGDKVEFHIVGRTSTCSIDIKKFFQIVDDMKDAYQKLKKIRGH